MKLTYKYRIYPNKKQSEVINHTLESCRWLYNYFLWQRKYAWENDKIHISMYDQHKMLPQLKKENLFLAQVPSASLQNVSDRIDRAFKAFFRRVKAKETPGFPRFKGKDRYDSICFPQWGNGIDIREGKLRLSKIGDIRVILHRPFLGVPKNCTIKRSSTGKWFATISCDNVPILSPQPVFNEIGIDVGIKNFATLSNGETIENPKFFKQEEKALAKAQRTLSKQVKGSLARAKKRKIVAHIYERTRNRRHNFAHQESRKIVNNYEIICVEDLTINRMVKTRQMAKSIYDAAWSDFIHDLSYKAECAGSKVVKVNPAYTSQDCSSCGYRQAMPLSERTFKCPSCGLVLDRDHNASKNILAVGMHSLAKVA
jgi:putative transposase